MIPVELMGLQVEPDTGAPVVLLRESADPHRLLPVFIGTPEAIAIAVGIEGAMASRPLTHDLLIDVLEGADTQLERVDVTALESDTFHAELVLRGPAGTRRVSSRPSDAIALAVRLQAPMFVTEAVLDQAGLEVIEVDIEADAPMDAAEVEETIEEFTSFLDEVDPADFDFPEADPPETEATDDEDPP